MSFDDEEAVEQTLVVIKQCFVYKIPPRATAQGHKAADWDLTAPMWTGRCVATSEGEMCKVKLEDPNTGELFATCHVTSSSVEPVTDSSRYYVVKIEDGSGRRAFIGMGFSERSDAFDFSAALQDHAKYQKQKKEAEEYAKKAASQPKTDYSLPQGAKIHVELKTKKPSSSSTSSTNNSNFTGFLPPPPGSKSVNKSSGANNTSSPLLELNKPHPPQQQASFDDFFNASSQNQFSNQQFSNQQFSNQQFQNQQFQPQQFPNQQQQFSNQQFSNQQFQNQPFQNQQFPPQQSNDIWGDFTGGSTSPSVTKQQNTQDGWM